MKNARPAQPRGCIDPNDSQSQFQFQLQFQLQRELFRLSPALRAM